MLPTQPGPSPKHPPNMPCHHSPGLLCLALQAPLSYHCPLKARGCSSRKPLSWPALGLRLSPQPCHLTGGEDTGVPDVTWPHRTPQSHRMGDSFLATPSLHPLSSLLSPSLATSYDIPGAHNHPEPVLEGVPHPRGCTPSPSRSPIPPSLMETKAKLST